MKYTVIVLVLLVLAGITIFVLKDGQERPVTDQPTMPYPGARFDCGDMPCDEVEYE